MAKRKAEALNDDEISGYLVEVSPIKTSQQNNKYFDGTINSDRKLFQHFVCFDVSKHSQFRSAGTQKSPVKLQRISQVPSKRDASPNDVLIKRTSSLNVLRSLDFSCKQQPKETSEQSTLEKIQNLPEKSKVNLVATVMSKSNSEIVDVRGTLINKCTSTIADNTQQMELTLWKHHIDKVVVGKTYHFTTVSTRFFHTYTLTTTSSTDINDHEDLLDIADYQEESTSTTITGAITQIILHKSAQCGNCHKSIKDLPTGNLVRCNSCNMKQLKSNLNNAYSCTMNVKDESTSQVIKLNMFSSVLVTFLTENLKLSLLSEMEDVEDYLLEQQHLTITYNSSNKVVLKFQKTR